MKRERQAENDSANSLRNKRKEHIERVLDMAGNDLECAATLLDIDVNKLRHWMRILGIEHGKSGPK